MSQPQPPTVFFTLSLEIRRMIYQEALATSNFQQEIIVLWYKIDPLINFCLASPHIAAEIGQDLAEYDLQILETRWKERKELAATLGNMLPKRLLGLKLHASSVPLWTDYRSERWTYGWLRFHRYEWDLGIGHTSGISDEDALSDARFSLRYACANSPYRWEERKGEDFDIVERFKCLEISL